MKGNIKPEDLHAVNTKSFGDTQAKGKKMSKWNAITLYDNDEKTYYRKTMPWRKGIQHLISLLEEFGDDERYKQSKILEKEYKKVKKLTRKEMERLLSLTDNCFLDYELH